MKTNSRNVACIEPVPGSNHYINTEAQDPEPPKGFIDTTNYRYKYDPTKPDKKGEFIGTMPAFQNGAKGLDFGNFELKPFEELEEGEEINMGKKRNLRQRPDKDEMQTVFMECKGSITSVANYFSVGWATAREWLADDSIIPEGASQKDIYEMLAAKDGSAIANSNQSDMTQCLANDDEPQEAGAGENHGEDHLEDEADGLDEQIHELLQGEDLHGVRTDQDNITVKDVLIYELRQREAQANNEMSDSMNDINQFVNETPQIDDGTVINDNDFRLADQEPIGYPVTEKALDLAPVKLAMIRMVVNRQVNGIDGLPASVALKIIGQIKDMEVA